MIKYAVYGGWITSKKDGCKHFVTPNDVIRLFQVNPRECVLWNYLSVYRILEEGIIWLGPRADGVYNLQAEIDKQKGDEDE